MSWQASQWAVHQAAGSGPAKSVLMVLAEAADQDGATFLSHDTIAGRAELSPRAVWAQMKVLEQRGLIARKRRYDARGHRTSDLVILALFQAAGDAVRDAVQPAQYATRVAGPTRTSCDPCSHVVHSLPARRAEEPVYEPVYEPDSSLLQLTHSDEHVDLGDAFDEWWEAYGNKVGRKKAEGLYRGIVRRGQATVDQLLDGARRYRVSDRVRRGFIKDPATWLNGGHWADEPAVPAAATAGALFAAMQVARDD